MTAQQQAAIVADHMESQLWDVDATAGVLTVYGRWDEFGDYVPLGGFALPSAVASTQAEYEAAAEMAPGRGSINLDPLRPKLPNGQPDPNSVQGRWIRIRVVADNGTVFDEWILLPQPCTPSQLARIIAGILEDEGWDVIVDGPIVTIRGHRDGDGQLNPVNRLDGYTYMPPGAGVPPNGFPRPIGPLPSSGGKGGTPIIPPNTLPNDIPSVIKKEFPDLPLPKTNRDKLP